MLKYFKNIGISKWRSKGLSDGIIKSSDKSIAPTLEYAKKRMYIKFNGSCFKKQNKTSFSY